MPATLPLSPALLSTFRRSSAYRNTDIQFNNEQMDTPIWGQYSVVTFPKETIATEGKKEQFTTEAKSDEPSEYSIASGTSFIHSNLSEVLSDADDETDQDIIYQIKTNLPLYEPIARRLLVLFHDAKEEGSSVPGISVDSLRHFYQFLLSNSNLKCPTLALTPDNDIFAEWGEGQGKLFNVHFLPDGDIGFVIFKQNERHPDRTERLSGVTSADNLIAMARRHGILNWLLR